MNDRICTMVAVVAALCATPAIAGPGGGSGIDYNWAEIHFANTDVDNIGDGSGFAVRGSASITDVVHLFGEYLMTDIDVDFANFSLDFSQYRFGAGFRTPLNNTIDLVGEVSFEGLDIESGGASADETGFGLKGELRSQLNDMLELKGFIRYIDLGGNDGDETFGGIGAIWDFTQNWSVSGELESSGDIRNVSFGARFRF